MKNRTKHGMYFLEILIGRVLFSGPGLQHPGTALQGLPPLLPVGHEGGHLGIETRPVVVVEKMHQLVEGHIIPQKFRAAGQGGVQSDVTLPPVAVAPLALHPAEFYLGEANA